LLTFLIVSDNHGSDIELKQIVERHSNVDFMIHCGDSELTFNSAEMTPFHRVKGNCDFDDKYPNELLQKLGNKSVLITHGHLFNVKSTLMNLYYRAEEVGASIVCFGHSHIAVTEQIGDILFINPGSICLPRLRKEKSYAVCKLSNKSTTVKYYNENGERIHRLGGSFTKG
jgi:putative phosphoesterase